MISLLLVPTYQASVQAQVVQPTRSSAPLAASTLIQFVQPTTKPDYDKEVLQPLHAAQAKKTTQDAIDAAQAAVDAKVAQDALEAQNAAQTVTSAYTAPTQPTALAGDAKSFIYSHESGGRTNAINASSGACGLGQALPCSKMPCSLSDYACQDTFFTSYMLSRYGSWENARAFWLQMHWW